MESNRKFTLIVFNTCTQEYEEVIVTEEVYRAYCRTRWNIKDNDQSFFDHEIQTSGMIGSQDGAYENFREFIDAINTPEHIILEQIKKEALYQAISALPAADQALVQGLFFKGQSELDYFDMGGCEYLESRIDATEYGELLPTVDDAVCGLISILDAMNTGDNDRFHLETLHHSKQEIRRILERGGKIDRTVEYAVDNEEEQYEQYHGFSMRM